MAFDTSMYGQIRPMELPNPLTQYGQIAQIQNAQNQNRLADLVFGEKQREVADTNKLNAIYSGALGPDGMIDRTKLFAGVAQGGLGSKLPGIQKQFVDSDKATADLDKTRYEVAIKRFETYQKVTGSLAQEPNLNKNMVVNAGRQLVEMGILPVAMYEKSVANMPDDPAMLRQTLLQAAKSQLTPEQMFTVFAPKPTEVDNGQQKFFKDMNPNSPTFGKMVGGAPVQKQATPGEVMSAETARRGQNMVDARQRDANNIAQGQKQQAGVVELRKEFNALPEVKNYKEVLPIIQSVSRAPDTPAGDIDLIYGVGKIMDPNSVVREGEMSLVIKSGSPAQRLMGYVNYVKGGGRLTAPQRQELMQVMESRVGGLRQNYDAARATYETAADKQGLPKEQIFIDNPAPPPAAAPKPAPGKPAVLPKGWSVKEG